MTPCDDGDELTTDDVCRAGVCQGRHSPLDGMDSNELPKTNQENSRCPDHYCYRLRGYNGCTLHAPLRCSAAHPISRALRTGVSPPGIGVHCFLMARRGVPVVQSTVPSVQAQRPRVGVRRLNHRCYDNIKSRLASFLGLHEIVSVLAMVETTMWGAEVFSAVEK